MPSILTDQIGNTVNIPTLPRRIVSVVPSQTELLFDLGLVDSIAGITKFCVHPSSAKSIKAIVGGTKNLRLEQIAALEPDLIVANKEENDRDQIEWLKTRFPTYTSDVRCLEHALSMISDMGCITETDAIAGEIIRSIANRFETVTPSALRPSVAYLIWKNPWMTVNKDTFIHDMLHRAGFNNVFADKTESRYPVVSESELKTVNPDFIFLSSEPFPFNESHERDMAALMPNSRVSKADGEMFSWYGSRLRQFNTNLLHEIS